MWKKALVCMLLTVVAVALVAAPASVMAAPLMAGQTRPLIVTVVGQNGRPMADATVQLLVPGSPDMTIAQTAENGEAILQVPGGFSFWLRAWAPGHAVVEVPYVPGTDGTVLTLQAAPYHASLVGIVTDDLGRPVPDAKVTVWRDGTGLEGAATTSAAGSYKIDKLPGGDGYSVQVEAPSFQPFVQTDITFEAGSVSRIDAGLTRATGTITGEVINPHTGRPVPAVHVELILNGWGVVDRTSTDAQGYFRFAAPPPPQGGAGYQMRIFGKGYETLTSAAFTVTAGGWTDFSGANRLELNPLFAELTGMVLADNGNPLPKAEIELQQLNLGTIETGMTDQDGHFAFTELPAGTYRVRTRQKENRINATTGWLTLAGGDRATADINAAVPDLNKYGSSAIVGTVRDHLDNPLAGATVTVQRGTEITEVVTDAHGRYRVPVQANVEDANVDPETATGYHVTVRLENYIPTDLQNPDDEAQPADLIDVRTSGTNRADFRMYPARAELAGRVLDERGTPMASIAVRLSQEGEGYVAETVTDDSGRYRFANLEVAKQTRYLPVVVQEGYFEASMAPDGAPTELQELSPGTVVTRTLTVRPTTGTIQGHVRAGSDKLSQSAMVVVTRPSDGRRWSVPVDEHGLYSVSVPAGPGDQYLVRVEDTDTKAGAAAAAVDLQENRAVTVNLDVIPYAAVTGRVYHMDGTPAADSLVALWAEGEGKMFATTRTDATGTYRFEGLEAGRRYSVAAWGGKDVWGALTPGEPIITPFLVPSPAETIWIDMRAPLLPNFLPAGATP